MKSMVGRFEPGVFFKDISPPPHPQTIGCVGVSRGRYRISERGGAVRLTVKY